MRFSTQVSIDAPAERVWALMSAVERWPEWTPTVNGVEMLGPAPLGPGSRVRVRQPKLPPSIYVVTHLQAGRRFTWVAGNLFGRVSAEHLIEPAVNGVRVKLCVEF